MGKMTERGPTLHPFKLDQDEIMFQDTPFECTNCDTVYFGEMPCLSCGEGFAIKPGTLQKGPARVLKYLIEQQQNGFN